MINHYLNQITTPEARERLERIKLVKPEKAQAVQMQLIQMAQQRQLGGKVGEKQLIEMLEGVGPDGGAKPEKKTVFQRKRDDFDESSDEYSWDD